MTKHATIAISGATGFIGRHLLQSLVRQRDMRVRLLVHRSAPPELATKEGLELVTGNLLDRRSLERWIQPGTAIINLAYLSGAQGIEDHLLAAENLAAACAQAGAARLIHCSTAAVVGRTSATVIDERVTCRPGNPYERRSWRSNKHCCVSAAPGLT